MLFLLPVVLIAITLIVIIIFKPKLLKTLGGKIIAFLAFFIFPALVFLIGMNIHFENSKKIEFCNSCHVMEPWVKSMMIENSNYIPAVHYQNNLVPKEKACYTCHKTYTMFGDIEAKLSGIGHLFKYTFGLVPDKIEMSRPYNNRECLHCHDGARSFVENVLHTSMIDDIKNNSISCIDCHNLLHEIEDLDNQEFWQGGEE